MHNISIFGTCSDAGKSTITFVIGKILQEFGYTVAPFKAQNVSNNAYVANDNSEISVAQHFQSVVLNVPTSWHNNPVLLKSGRGNNASVIVAGKTICDKDVKSYYKDLDTLKPTVNEGFEYLNNKYDCVIAEGAGSPVELNLMDKDLSNIYIATQFNTKIILVADIEKGGVFASVYGVYNLLPKNLQKNVIGCIINKFRGDITLFDNGRKIIEERFKIPVLGVLPYKPLNLGFEDSQSLLNYTQEKQNITKKIAVIAYPTMSNYNDFEPLISNNHISVEFVHSNSDFNNYDEVILPGSKLVIKDLEWLKKNGIYESLQKTHTPILGICGGYEMMFNSIQDPLAIENRSPLKTNGLGFIDDDIVLTKNKILKHGKYNIFDKEIIGFEIHHGVSKKYPLYYEKNNIRGTFVHGLFNDNNFINYRNKTIDSFVNFMKKYLDSNKILDFVI